MLQKISTNQKLIKEYSEAKDIYDYLSGAMGHEIVESKYGKFNFDYDYDSDSDYTQKNAELNFSSDGFQCRSWTNIMLWFSRIYV
jgi:hypothetical protein